MHRFVSQTDIRPLVKATLGGAFTLRPLMGGLLNQNYVVETGRDTTCFVLKIYRPEIQQEKVEEMHRLMTHCSRRGIPLSLPISTYRLAGHVAALYPYIEGENATRFGNTLKNVGLMGEMLGRVDKALDTFRSSVTKPASIELAKWDPAKTLNEMADIRRAAKHRRGEVREIVERALVIYERIMAEGDWDKTRFTKLPVKICHNDFHINNVLMRDNKLVAVLDWEKAGWDWRAFEIMRTITFNCRKSDRELDWTLVRAYVRGYRQYASFTTRERELAYDAGVYKLFFSLWAMKQYLAGHKECKANVLRRARLLPYLFKHRVEFTERIAHLLE